MKNRISSAFPGLQERSMGGNTSALVLPVANGYSWILTTDQEPRAPTDFDDSCALTLDGPDGEVGYFACRSVTLALELISMFELSA